MGRLTLFSWVSIVAFHIISMSFYWYDHFLWLDILMHLIGGAWVGLFFVFLFQKYLSNLSSIQFLPFLILGLGFVVLIGVLWEFYEYLADVYLYKVHPLQLAPNPKNLPDTLADLVNDLIGGFLTISLFYFKKKLQLNSVNKIGG